MDKLRNNGSRLGVVRCADLIHGTVINELWRHIRASLLIVPLS
jgi:hypothetical protein